MPEQNQGYVDGLVAQLGQRHASLLATAEDDLALLRGRLALANTLESFEPRQESTDG